MSKKIVTPLMWLLSQCSLEMLFGFVDRLHLNVSSTRNRGQGYKTTIKAEGGFYCVGHGSCQKGALADALTKFLRTEQRDYHRIMNPKRSDRVTEALWYCSEHGIVFADAGELIAHGDQFHPDSAGMIKRVLE